MSSSMHSLAELHLPATVLQMRQTLVLLAAGVSAAWVVQAIITKTISLRRAFKALGDTPGGTFIWLHPFRSLAPVLAPFFPFHGRVGNYYDNYHVYKKYGSTILGTVKFWDSTPTFWVSDADALKVVSNNRTTFRRDLEGYNVVCVYGPSLVGEEGAEWKRYRAVAKPAFNEANNALVWQHATRVVNEWFSHIDREDKRAGKIRVDLLKDCTEVALLILSSAAFGKHNSWNDHSDDEPKSSDHKVPFRPTVTMAVDNLVPKILTPDWMFALARYIPMPKIVTETQESFIGLRLHMLELVASARAWVAGESDGNNTSMDAALLQNLVKANLAQEDSSQRRRLTDQELISNMFMFLLAGHETSAHSLCFTVALMALYPDVQQKMYEEAARLWPKGAPSAETVTSTNYKDDMTQLEYTTAAFREALRLFPAVPRIASPVPVETTLQAKRFEGSKQISEFTVNIPARSIVVIDIIGLHMNPIHWGEDVSEFRPERFVDTDSYRWPRDAFLAFSAGPRSCMGERFAIVESVCVLAHIARKYKISVSDELKSKSFEEQKKALLDWIPRMTLIPTNSFVNFEPRKI